MELVLDASIILKWALLEENSEQARAYRMQAFRKEIIIHATELVFFEVGNILVMKQFPQEMTIALMQDIYMTPLTMHPLRQDLSVSTIQLARATRTTFYDSSYVALAQHLGCPFVTADEKLFLAMKQADIPVSIELFH